MLIKNAEKNRFVKNVEHKMTFYWLCIVLFSIKPFESRNRDATILQKKNISHSRKTFFLQLCQSIEYEDIDSTVQTEKCRLNSVRFHRFTSDFKHKQQHHNVKCSMDCHYCEWLYKNKWNCTILWTNKLNWTKMDTVCVRKKERLSQPIRFHSLEWRTAFMTNGK